jgi:imidazoleglycerol phosphate synthase glutamine amidotransferase subunit HisH
VHGGAFVGALQRGGVLACQFHPELSGAWGAQLIATWATQRMETAEC